ncbi:site-specific DNA-methyltransferase [Tritonibacter mobilis]|uniref:site-specific DNA-methyltransferase n=1 Tax=Tritonibacter mobilis TaxID=379347 RepID=UPI0014037A03|nr:site-specific DNA-methyltransferase [Tritonibacter mobilis]NHM19667.1 site-specific DNA-methyltransferase [Tritonibacter mobilis]NHM23816.1 site-specific DNA-methyltransferase [Tritonibacter mobilis]
MTAQSKITPQAWPAAQVEMWQVADLVPYAKNARQHPPEQIDQIAASMERFGFTIPMLVAEDGTIIAGHGRLMAAAQLGLAEVPVMVARGWSEEDRRLYTLADNRLAEIAEWDPEMLRIEIGELREDFGIEDMSLIGFSAEDLAEILPDALIDTTGGLTDPDDVPEVPEAPVTRPGDVWLMGKHRLLCGDSTVATDVQKVLGDVKADLCFCDPPYNVDYAGGVGAEKAGKGRRIKNDALGDGFGQFLYDACVLINAHTDGAVYICMSSSELQTLQSAFKSAGGHWSTFIIWAKDRFTLGRADYQRQYEPILYGWPEGVKRHWCGDRDQGDVWNIERPHKNDLHPTMKPVSLVERAIRNSSRKGDLVFDPFGGSGTTLIAAEKTGRHASLIELDPKYVDVIVRRWQEFTGECAVLESSGQSFDDLNSGETPQVDDETRI